MKWGKNIFFLKKFSDDIWGAIGIPYFFFFSQGAVTKKQKKIKKSFGFFSSERLIWFFSSERSITSEKIKPN